jgi:CelD/BcsL family acetyltransferase involved in cellulose biosynthesis
VDPVETFLHLEHLGWKGANRTSLRSSPLDEAFFRDLVALSGPGAFFTELLVDGSVIASTSNFRIGDNGFAFKSGYHPEFSEASPGLLNEIFLLEHLEQASDLAYLDSGAVEGSYMDTLWPDRDILYSGIVTASAFTRQVTSLMSGVRSIKRRLYSSRLMASSG